MSFVEAAATAKRVLVRETAGAVLRYKAARADNAEKIAELVTLRAEDRAPLTPEQIVATAKAWTVEPAVIHALADAESSGHGFEQSGHAMGRAIPAVECHAFSCATFNAFDLTRPDVSYPEWIAYVRGAAPPVGMARHPYAMGYDDRWGLFVRQAELSIEGACSALSLGRFQPLIGRTPMMRRHGMKENWRALGYASAEQMFRALCVSEMEQLEALRRFIVANNLTQALRDRDWRTIARVYNGTGQIEVYAAKAAAAYKIRARLYQ